MSDSSRVFSYLEQEESNRVLLVTNKLFMYIQRADVLIVSKRQ